MDAGAELGRNPVSKHQIQLSMEMSRLTRDGTAEPVSRDQILRPGQPYPVYPSRAICDDDRHIHVEEDR